MIHTLVEVVKRLSAQKSRGDFLLGSFLACSVFVLYVQSLVPSILPGDPAQFQYIPAVLGIPYPPGFPLYILVGYLWSLLPIGTLAYRMNLLSAVFGALTVGTLFVVSRRQNLHWLAALAGASALAFLPPFWQYATFAAEYTLHTLLVVLLIAFLAEWEQTRQTRWLRLAALVFGFGLTNHPTFLLLAPATMLFVALVAKRELIEKPRLSLSAILLAALPLGLYLYIPLRGQQLFATSTAILPDWQSVVAQGIVSPFYKQTSGGLLEFFTAQSFVKSVGAQWKWDTLISDWSAMISQTVNLPALFAALVGVVAVAWKRANLAAWLLLAFATFTFVTFQYVYTALANVGDWAPYFAKFFLPGFIVFVLFAGYGVDAVLRAIEVILVRIRVRSIFASGIAVLVVLALVVAAINDLAARHTADLIQQSKELEEKWRGVQQYPPEQGAALMGHWGDLTPLWYFQSAEGWRRDLVGFFPPTDDQANMWIKMGKPLYLAGPLLEWAPNIPKDDRLTPWGALVRVSSKQEALPSPLSHSTEVTFADTTPRIRLLAFDVLRDNLRAGEPLDVALYWQPLAALPLGDYVVGLSLDNSVDEPLTRSFPITVSWLPGNKLDIDQHALGMYRFTIPFAVPQGIYRLRVAVYSIPAGKNLAGTPEAALEIGTIRIAGALSQTK